jgi:hypothetical protein
MPILELSDEQVVELLKQLPPERQRATILALASGAGQCSDERMQSAEGQLRLLSAGRGLEWDKMSDDQRQDFVEDLLHEDRSCRKWRCSTRIFCSRPSVGRESPSSALNWRERELSPG